jgi:hypothetical protein
MTTSAAFDAPAVAPPAAAPQPSGLPPAITSNRRRLDNRFPVLAFSVRTQGKPWFEVLLTTDGSLFDPSNAARRTPANFYAGRQDGGLLRSAGDETAYVVPAAVLRRFVTARPRPTEIFYTAATYDTPEGPPVLAHPVAYLSTMAPSVSLSADFEAQTMAVVLGIPAEKLQPVDASPAGPPPAVPEHDVSASSEAAAAWEEDPRALALDEDHVSPDEGYEVFSVQHGTPEPDAHPAPESNGNGHYDAAAYGDEEAYAYEGEDDESHAYEDEEGYAYEEPVAGDGHDDAAAAYEEEGVSGAVARDEGFAYDDGFGNGAGEWSEAASSVYPAGFAEPEPLEDADEEAAMQEAMAADLEPYDESQSFAAEEHEPYDEGAGYEVLEAEPEPVDVATALETPLDIPGKIALVSKLGRLFESNDGYAGVGRDFEFNDRRFSQYQKWHVGLSYGFVQFTQDSGGLGRLLRMMRERDAARFREIFGPDSDALVEVTNRQGPSGSKVPGGRSVRVQPVGGADLWNEPWLASFHTAGAHPPFQAAQNELAVRMYLDPMLPFAAGFGLESERALAIVVDRSIQMGAGGARRWLARTLNPIATDAQRQQALAALGFADLAAFQRSVHVPADGDFGPLTQAAMVGALRHLGAASPIPIPTREQMLETIATRAAEEHRYWAHRPRTLRTSREFADTVLTWQAAP